MATEPTPIRRPRADQARQVADILRHQIHSGAFVAALPTEHDLAAEFAAGLARFGTGGLDAVRLLADDRDPLVRAAALTAFAALGCNDDDARILAVALKESAWQVRQGAARGLAGADADVRAYARRACA